MAAYSSGVSTSGSCWFMDEVYSSFGVSGIFAFAEREVEVVAMRFTDKLGFGDAKCQRLAV